jgi:hypothetical protein
VHWVGEQVFVLPALGGAVEAVLPGGIFEPLIGRGASGALVERSLGGGPLAGGSSWRG